MTTIDEGRLAGLFCQLHRERFTGVLRVTSGDQYASIGFRAGAPVAYEDAMQAHTLGEELVARGQLTRAQYSAVISRVTDGLVEDETLAFCEHAVALGYLTQADANVELSERTRTRLIQCMAWTDCETELDADESALTTLGEFPQELGAIVYMGVRTFYDDDCLRRCAPEAESGYLRLLAAPASIAHFFGLDDDEFRLLKRIDPDKPLASALAGSKLDESHCLSLLVLLRLGGFSEASNTPFSQQPDLERSGARPVPASTAAKAAVSARPEPRAPATIKPDANLAMPKLPPSSSVDATQEALLEAAARAARSRKNSSSTIRRVLPDVQPSGPLIAPPEAPPTQVVTRAPHRAVSRPLSGPLSGMQAEPPPSAAAPTAPVDPQVRTEYTKAHLNELLKRRKQGAPGDAGQGAPKKDPATELRQARGLLRDQQYSRAEEILRGLTLQDPQNDVYRAYHLWSRLRAHPEADETHAGELLDLAKKLVQDSEHGPFAVYMLGHLYLNAKKDELAEKYFRRAHAADKTNKDAERHLLILERRKQNAAEAEAAANRKIFGITIANPKPKS